MLAPCAAFPVMSHQIEHMGCMVLHGSACNGLNTQLISDHTKYNIFGHASGAEQDSVEGDAGPMTEARELHGEPGFAEQGPEAAAVDTRINEAVLDDEGTVSANAAADGSSAVMADHDDILATDGEPFAASGVTAEVDEPQEEDGEETGVSGVEQQLQQMALQPPAGKPDSFHCVDYLPGLPENPLAPPPPPPSPKAPMEYDGSL